MCWSPRDHKELDTTEQLNNNNNRYLHKRNVNLNLHKNMYMKFYSCTVQNSQKVGEKTQLFINWWINRLWCVYIIDYYSIIQKNEVLISATTWLNVENMMLSEWNWSQKITLCMIPFVWKVQIRNREQVSGCWAWGKKGTKE